jgi:SAM-dependent methyltransferase
MNMSDAVVQFYDQLADDYHLIFADWQASIHRQATILDALIQRMAGPPPYTVLDCACGIGTQTLGLADCGYTVYGTDISPAAIERARREAQAMHVDATFGVADLRTLATDVVGSFDIVIACDNALPHLIEDADLLQAARNIRAKIAPGGLMLASIRDYDALSREHPLATEPRVFDSPTGRRIVFQVWDWAEDGRTYALNHCILSQDGDHWRTMHGTTVYRALLRDDLDTTLRAAGFTSVHWHMPDTTGYHQPIVIAH